MENQNKIELNPNMQYILAGDISGSMDSKDSKCGGDTRYNYMLEKFKSFIKESMDFDPDGPTILLFGEDVHSFLNTTLEKVESNLTNVTFEGFTNTHLVVDEAWKLHCSEKSELLKQGKTHPGTTLFIFTDGEPTNRAALEREIRKIVNAMDREDEFNIGFILVGSTPNDLQEYLHKLDDGLNEKYDIVGVTHIEGLSFLKAVNNAVNE